MEVTERRVFALDEASRPGEVRRAASAMASRLGCDASDNGRVALIVTEAATNVVKHATGGEMLLYGNRSGDAWTVGFVAVDRGPGMRDVRASLEDGASSTGTPGTGLGAIRRLSTAFDLYSSPSGTAVFAEVSDGRRRPAPSMEIGGLRVPHPKEQICGDDFAFLRLGDGRCLVLLVDGLGHGVGAAEAAEEATRLFRSRPGKDPEAILAMLHEGLRGTRGAAAAVAHIDLPRRIVRFAGVGNITAMVQADGLPRNMVSHHGTLGHQAPRLHEFTYAWPDHAVVVMHSDGMSARWDLGAYPGLVARHPMLIAGVLYRDFRRQHDDASVVVLREARP